MDVESLLVSLARPEAFPNDPGSVEVIQTHASMVFLTPSEVFKVKKPVDFGFLDYSTLEKRQHFCQEEVRINRRLAASVYLGVVPVVERDGQAWLYGPGETIDFAVHMERLPDDRSLEALMARGEDTEKLWSRIGTQLRQFHLDAPRSEKSRHFGSFEIVAENARDNFDQTESHIGKVVSATLHDRLRRATDDYLSRERSRFDARVTDDRPCPTHGDLRLDHVYSLPDRTPPNDLPVIDAIEFNDRFRYADPVADLAFLLMDLQFRGEHDAAERLERTYFDGHDPEGRRLLPFYVAYRAVVRAKVDGLQALAHEIPEAERQQRVERSQAHWLLAWGQLAPPGSEPRLTLMGGLPGTGKSTVARFLADRTHEMIIRSDVVRKELFAPELIAPGGQPTPSHGAEDESGIYTPEHSQRTYAECAMRAREELLEGRRVIVDASFHSASMRRGFLALGEALCVPVDFVICSAPEEVVLDRLRSRVGDASDADETIYHAMVKRWEAPDGAQPSRESFRRVLEVDTSTDWRESLALG